MQIRAHICIIECLENEQAFEARTSIYKPLNNFEVYNAGAEQKEQSTGGCYAHDESVIIKKSIAHAVSHTTAAS